MKTPNFKITICGLNLYFSVHCVLFGLLLHLCYRWGNRREKNHTGWFFSPWFSCSLSAYEYDQDKEQDCKNYCCSFEYHIHRAILNSIIKLLWQLQISLLDFLQPVCFEQWVCPMNNAGYNSIDHAIDSTKMRKTRIHKYSL